MCIIIAKTKGRAFNIEELEQSVDKAKIHNCHGSGYAIKREGDTKIKLVKGFVYSSILIEHLISEKIQENDEIMIHLRFSTSGIINTANCHPFIISNNIKEIILDEIETDKPVISHNGTFTGYVKKDSIYSDTVHYIQEFLAAENVLDSIYKLYDVDMDFVDSALGNNRLCVIFPDDRDMMLLGMWNVPEKEKGEKTNFYYSNYYYCNPNNGYVKPHANTKFWNQGTTVNRSTFIQNRAFIYPHINEDDEWSYYE